MITTEFNTSAAADAIRRTMSQMEDMTPLYQGIADYMTEATRRRFITGTAPDGTKWAPKKQSTLDRYKRLGYGNLPHALVGHYKRLSREVIGAATRSGAVIGSALLYSRVMQEGAAKGEFGADRRGRPIPWGRIPARVWLGVSAEDERVIIMRADKYLAEGLDQGG